MNRRRWRGRASMLLARIVALLLIDAVPAAGLLSPTTFPRIATTSPLVGFSFSPLSVDSSLQSPERALTSLLQELEPDVVRLPVYWDAIAPTPNGFDYTETDRLLRTVADYDSAAATRQARILLVVGARNIVYPEVHVPNWMVSRAEGESLARLYQTAEYKAYLRATFQRYASLPLLYGWQVENEPLDNVTSVNRGNISLSPAAVTSEIGLLRAVDEVHPIVVTTYNSSHVDLDREGAGLLGWLYRLLPGPKPVGHPAQALDLGDALGLDVYAVTASTPLSEAGAAQRIQWKADTLDYWSGQAAAQGKSLWITEMQGEAWDDASEFTPEDLDDSAVAYRGHGASLTLLWGVESWLASDQWMSAGIRAMAILRS